MYFEEFSISELEKQLERIETVEEKIEFISDEMLRCERAIQELQYDLKPVISFEIKSMIKQNVDDQKFIKLVNEDNEIRQVIAEKIVEACKEKLCERNNHFIERAKIIKENLETKFDLHIKSVNASNTSNVNIYDRNERILWMCGREKLLKMFAELVKHDILPKYKTTEILSHFADEKQNPFVREKVNQKMFRWRESDSSFAVFVNELVKRNAIDDMDKFKVCLKHFLNRKGEPFRNLAQKKYYTENFCKTGNLIREILNSINLCIVVLLYNLLSSFMLE